MWARASSPRCAGLKPAPTRHRAAGSTHSRAIIITAASDNATASKSKIRGDSAIGQNAAQDRREPEQGGANDDDACDDTHNRPRGNLSAMHEEPAAEDQASRKREREGLKEEEPRSVPCQRARNVTDSKLNAR